MSVSGLPVLCLVQVLLEWQSQLLPTLARGSLPSLLLACLLVVLA